MDQDKTTAKATSHQGETSLDPHDGKQAQSVPPSDIFQELLLRPELLESLLSSDVVPGELSTMESSFLGESHEWTDGLLSGPWENDDPFSTITDTAGPSEWDWTPLDANPSKSIRVPVTPAGPIDWETALEWKPRDSPENDTLWKYSHVFPAENAGSAPSDGRPIPRRWECLYPGCSQKPFGRTADLERHIHKVHPPSLGYEKYTCDYKACTRASDYATPKGGGARFSRRDHLRDHLRYSHKEDVLKRGSSHDAALAWLREETRMHEKWWRCGKCLQRVTIDNFGWQCPECGYGCEEERQVVWNERMASEELIGDAKEESSAEL